MNRGYQWVQDASVWLPRATWMQKSAHRIRLHQPSSAVHWSAAVAGAQCRANENTSAISVHVYQRRSARMACGTPAPLWNTP